MGGELRVLGGVDSSDLWGVCIQVREEIAWVGGGGQVGRISQEWQGDHCLLEAR